MADKVILKRVGKFTGATMISRVLGFLRDSMVAHFFGGERLTDAFYTAFRISNLLRSLLAEGGVSSAFIPVFSHVLKNESKEEAQKFINAAFTFLTCITLGIVLIGMVFAQQLTSVITPGFEAFPEKFRMTVELTRWMFPFFLFICIAALLGGVLNSLKHFFVPAIAPSMLSIAQIGYLLIFAGHAAPENLIVGLAVAVVVGGAAHFAMQIPPLYKENFRLGFNFDWSHPHLKQVGYLLLPAVMGLSVEQINGFVSTICASYLAKGSVTALYNSTRLMQLPLALFGTAVASVSLPTMSDHTAEKNHKMLLETVVSSLRMVLFAVAPAAVGLMMLAYPVVQLLFEHGQFTSYATSLTVQALWGLCTGLVAFSAVRVLAGAFYALRTPSMPVKTGCFCMAANIALNLLLMRPLGVGGLALATALSSWINAGTLYFLLRKRMIEDCGAEFFSACQSRLFREVLKVAAGCALMALALSGLSNALGFLPLLIFVPAAVLCGAAVFLGAHKLLGFALPSQP